MGKRFPPSEGERSSGIISYPHMAHFCCWALLLSFTLIWCCLHSHHPNLPFIETSTPHRDNCRIREYIWVTQFKAGWPSRPCQLSAWIGHFLSYPVKLERAADVDLPTPFHLLSSLHGDRQRMRSVKAARTCTCSPQSLFLLLGSGIVSSKVKQTPSLQSCGLALLQCLTLLCVALSFSPRFCLWLVWLL